MVRFRQTAENYQARFNGENENKSVTKTSRHFRNQKSIPWWILLCMRICAECESNVPNQLMMKAWKSLTQKKKRRDIHLWKQLNISASYRTHIMYSKSQCDFVVGKWNRKHLETELMPFEPRDVAIWRIRFAQFNSQDFLLFFLLHSSLFFFEFLNYRYSQWNCFQRRKWNWIWFT